MEFSFIVNKPFQNAHLLHNLISIRRTYNIKNNTFGQPCCEKLVNQYYCTVKNSSKEQQYVMGLHSKNVALKSIDEEAT